MLRVCGWCNKLLGEKPPYADKSITHGMCEACLAEQLDQIKKEGTTMETTMTQPKPMPMVTKLLSRHTEAGIEVSYDDHCVRLCRNGEVLGREDSTGRHVAVWLNTVTFEQLVAEADHYLPEEVTV